MHEQTNQRQQQQRDDLGPAPDDGLAQDAGAEHQPGDGGYERDVEQLAPGERGYDDQAADVRPTPTVLQRWAVGKAIERNNASAEAREVLASFRAAMRLPEATGDGYDEAAVQHVARFQQDAGSLTGQKKHSIRIDGVWTSAQIKVFKANYSAEGTEATEGQLDASALWPAQGASMAARLAHYSRVCALFGHTVTRAQPTLLGLRGLMHLARWTHDTKHLPAYDDTFILLDHGASGAEVRAFSGATHAYQAASGASPDVDGDGANDVASIRANDGARMYSLTARGGRMGGHHTLAVNSDAEDWIGEDDAPPKFWGDTYVPVDRDTNHDRVIDDAERDASRARSTPARGGQDTNRQVVDGMGDYAKDVLFHAGWTERPSSIACQTARGEDVDHLHATARERGGLDYLVVEAREAIERLAKASGGLVAEHTGGVAPRLE